MIAKNVLGALLMVACAAPGGAAEPPPARQIQFNGQKATAADLAILAGYEKLWGVEVPSGSYWYDGVSGAAGQWGGPTRGFLAPGLALAQV